MLNKIFVGFLIFVPITAAAYLLKLPAIVVFSLSALSIVPLAKFIGQATDELAVRTSPALGGLLNATFGNATELIIGVLAVRRGLVEVVKASITGSIIGNLLLVLGMAIFFGGLKFKTQKFNQTAARAGASTLFLSVIALATPAIFLQTAPMAGWKVIDELSIAVAALMVIAYVGGLIFTLKTHKHLYIEEVGKTEAKWSVKKSVFILLVAALTISWMSEILVGSIEPVVKTLGWTELFIGVIFVAVIGNAAEHTSAIVMALKNKMQLALQVSIGSATQVAMFVMPILVFSSLLLKNPMSLVFSAFELIVMVLAVLIANLVVEDGETNWLEGLQLILAYVIIGTAFFFHP